VELVLKHTNPFPQFRADDKQIIEEKRSIIQYSQITKTIFPLDIFLVYLLDLPDIEVVINQSEQVPVCLHQS
jgi:hypothetical protein